MQYNTWRSNGSTNTSFLATDYFSSLVNAHSAYRPQDLCSCWVVFRIIPGSKHYCDVDPRLSRWPRAASFVAVSQKLNCGGLVQGSENIRKSDTLSNHPENVWICSSWCRLHWWKIVLAAGYNALPFSLALHFRRKETLLVSWIDLYAFSRRNSTANNCKKTVSINFEILGVCALKLAYRNQNKRVHAFISRKCDIVFANISRTTYFCVFCVGILRRYFFMMFIQGVLKCQQD